MSDNGTAPAYPVAATQFSTATRGLTKREAFAMAAMQGMLAADRFPGDDFAQRAVYQADALLAALDPTP